LPVSFQARHSKCHRYAVVNRVLNPLGRGFDLSTGHQPGRKVPILFPHPRCEMKDPTSVADLRERLGAPAGDTVESLRLLKAFLKLGPGQRFEIIELVERLATGPASSPGGSDHSLS
jgi:hypothetical protein